MASIFQRFSKKNKADAADSIDVPIQEKKKIPLKVWLGIAAAVAVVILILVIVLFVAQRKNDGARYAEKLSQHLGKSMYSAGVEEKLDMHVSAGCTYLNDVEEKFDSVCESQKTVKIGGVSVPEWAIYCYADAAGNLEQINYYDFTLLEKHEIGVKTSGYILLTDISNGMSRADALAKIEIDPYSITYFASGTRQYKFKYCYKDDTTKDMIAYTITVLFDKEDNVTAVFDTQNNFVADYLVVQ